MRPSRRAGSSAIAQALLQQALLRRHVGRCLVRGASIAPATRIACSELVVEAQDVGAGADRQGDRGDRPPLALARRPAAPPRSRRARRR